jgi:hypothetical protein
MTIIVPHLQDVFQADAAHMNFGKYTLFYCYDAMIRQLMPTHLQLLLPFYLATRTKLAGTLFGNLQKDNIHA